MDTLYQDKLLGLAAHARTVPLPQDYDLISEVRNPLCGDRIRIAISISDSLKTPHGRSQIISAGIEAKGCALCEAGAGLWHQVTHGIALTDLSALRVQLADWLAGQEKADRLGPDISAFEPVRAIKNRHKCVLLAFDTADAFTPVLSSE